MDNEPLLSISEASHILGVSEPALRQWTDEGKIKAFITPGGHRRYSKAELKKFLSSHQKMLGIKDLVTELEDTVPMHREIAQAFLQSTTWYNQLSEESQQHLASLGRRLLNLLIKSVTEPSRQGQTLKAIQDVGYDLGKTLAKSGLPLTESVRAFLQHRHPIMRVATHLMKKREGLNRRVVEAIPLIDHALDEALVSLVATHQQYRNSLPRTERGSAE